MTAARRELMDGWLPSPLCSRLERPGALEILWAESRAAQPLLGLCCRRGFRAMQSLWLSRSHFCTGRVKVGCVSQSKRGPIFLCSSLPPGQSTDPWSLDLVRLHWISPSQWFRGHWAFDRRCRFSRSYLLPPAMHSFGVAYKALGSVCVQGDNCALTFGCDSAHRAVFVDSCCAPQGHSLVSFDPCIVAPQERAYSPFVGCSFLRTSEGLCAKQWYRWLWDHGYAPLSACSSALKQDPGHLDFTILRLLWIASCIVPLVRGMCFCIFLVLLRALTRPLYLGSFPLGHLLSAPYKAASLAPLRALGRVASVDACLDWSPHPPRQKPRQTKCRSNCLTARGSCFAVRMFLALFAIPTAIPVPTVLVCSAWCFAPGAVAMTRPPTSLDPDPLEPPRFVPAAPTPVWGTGVANAPASDSARLRNAAQQLYQGPLPWQPDEGSIGTRHLGVYLYTPHYKPEAFAVKLYESSCMRSVLDTILECAPGDAFGVCDLIVPLRPQRYGGYLFALRMPSIIRGMQGGMAGVVLDLSHVGGGYFATVLPREMEYSQLHDFVLPLTKAGVETVFFFIGLRQRPWPSCAMITLRDGDVIQALDSDVPRRAQVHPEALFQDQAELGPMCHFFDVDRPEARWVMYRDSRYTIAPYLYPGRDIVEYFADGFRVPTASLHSCSFPTGDLDVHGMHCDVATAIFDVPAVRVGDPMPDRCDIFTLCDFRPLGFKPRVILSHVPLLHVPSLISDHEIQLPAAFSVKVLGGKVRGDHVKLRGNSTLVFIAELVEDSSQPSDSSSEASEPEAAAEIANSPARDARSSSPQARAAAVIMPDTTALPVDRHVDGMPVDDHGWAISGGTFSHLTFIDPTLPDGHGWNAGIEPERVPEAVSPPASGTAPREGDMPETQHDSAWPLVFPEDAIEPEDDTAAEPVQGTPITALVYTPDFTPEMHTIDVSFPCGVNRLMVAVNVLRDADLARHFPFLYPVTPQLHREFATFVAVPRWLQDRAIVLIDTSRVNGAVFAVALPSPTSKASILAAANLPTDGAFGIFVHSLLRPLDPSSTIHLVTGMSIAILPQGIGAPASEDLAHMLVRDDGWDVHADVPGPFYAPGSHFHLLTDGLPRLFEVLAGRRPHFKADIAGVLQVDPSNLTLVTVKPRIRDLFVHGRLATGVLVATVQLGRAQGALSESRSRNAVVFIDGRRVLAGMRWLLLPSGAVSVHSVAAHFFHRCPEGFRIVIRGLPLRASPGGPVFEVSSGSTLVVTFEEGPARAAPAQGPVDPGPDDPPPPRPPGQGGAPGPDGDGPDGASPDSSQPARSRSPRTPRMVDRLLPRQDTTCPCLLPPQPKPVRLITGSSLVF